MFGHILKLSFFVLVANGLFGCGDSEKSASDTTSSSPPYTEQEASDLLKRLDAGEPFSIVDTTRVRLQPATISFVKANPPKADTKVDHCYSEGTVQIDANGIKVDVVLLNGSRYSGKAHFYGGGAGYKALATEQRSAYFALRSMGSNKAYSVFYEDVSFDDKLRLVVSRAKNGNFVVSSSFQKRKEGHVFCKSTWKQN